MSHIGWALRIAVPSFHITFSFPRLGATYRRPQGVSYFHNHFYFHWALRTAVPKDFLFPYLFPFPLGRYVSPSPRVSQIHINLGVTYRRPQGFLKFISTWALRIAVPRGSSYSLKRENTNANTNTSTSTGTSTDTCAGTGTITNTNACTRTCTPSQQKHIIDSNESLISSSSSSSSTKTFA